MMKTTAVTLLISIMIMGGLFGTAHPASAAVSDWQKGVDMVPNYSTDYGSASFDQSVKNAAAIGVNYITLNIPLYQSSVNSTDVQTGGSTPTDQSLKTAISYIHSIGLHVMLKFQLFPNDGQWSAYINPSDRTTWFTNYGNMIDHYGAIAQSLGVEQICIGTELIDMATANANSSNTANWQSLIGKLRSMYGGKLTYDANWGGSGFADEADNIAFWSSLDYISISAYYNLSGDGSVSSLIQSWGNINSSSITPLENRWNKPIIFGEVGYKAISDSYTHPWMWWEGGAADPTAQANDYQALFQYWNNYSFMQGVDLWEWSTDPNAGGSGDNNYTPQNKAAQTIMQNWFASSSGSGSGGGGNGSSTTGTAPTFTAQASVNPASPAPGANASFSMTVNATKAAASGINVDAEIYNASGNQVFQKVFSGQNFTAGGSETYTFSWTPPSAGNYVLKTGVFSGDWQTAYYWNNQTLSFAASAVSTSPNPTSTPSSGAVQVWWPTNGATVSGVQPFKAMLTNASVDSYNMYWQVDGGQLNAMATNNIDYPHKESSVDLSSWNWQPSGNYGLTFLAKALNGTTIAQTALTIHVTH